MSEDLGWEQTGPSNWFRRYPNGYAHVNQPLESNTWTYDVWRSSGSYSYEIMYGGGRRTARDAMMAADRAYLNDQMILPEPGHGHQAQLRVAEYRRPR